jgi:hypothetical protein
LLVVEMLLFWRPHLCMVSQDKAFPPYTLAQFLEDKSKDGEFRVLDTTGVIDQGIAARHGLEIITGYHAGVYKYQLELYNKIWRWDDSDVVEIRDHPFDDVACPVVLDLMNVQYVISDKPSLGPDYDTVYQTPSYEFRIPRFIHRRKEVLPRVYVVPNAFSPALGQSVLNALCALNPRIGCLVDDAPVQGTASYQEVHFKRISFSEINLDFDCDGRGMVVVSQSWHPDWRATDDGNPVQVRRVNHAQIGISVEPGHHDLRIWYFPWDFYLGCVISCSTIVILGVSWVIGTHLRGRIVTVM